MTRMETVTSDGAALAVRIDGEGNRPWLLVSNSLAADLRMWDDQIPLLTRTHRVLRYDTRGHGASDAPEGPYDFDMLVSDMIAVLDHFGVETADVMGLSLGGMTALGLGLDRPERVRRLIVCDARADAPPPFVEGWDARIAAVSEGGMQAVAEGTLERWFTAACRAARPQAIERARDMILTTSPAGYVGCAHALKGLDYLRRLDAMRRPVLYVVGSEDGGAPKEVMAAMADETPDGRLTILPNLAHIPNMEDPAAFAGAVEGWLAEASQAARAA